MNTNLHEREFDGVVADGADNLEVSRAIKAWLSEQHAIRPFNVGWPLHRRLEAELCDAGFANIKMSRVEPHAVFVITGQSRCHCRNDLQKIFKKLAKKLGFQFHAADVALSFSRGRFRLVLYLPTQHNTLENLADDCPFDMELADE